MAKTLVVSGQSSDADEFNRLGTAFASLAAGQFVKRLTWLPPHRVLRCPCCTKEAEWVHVSTYLCKKCTKALTREEKAVWMAIKPHLKIRHLYMPEPVVPPTKQTSGMTRLMDLLGK